MSLCKKQSDLRRHIVKAFDYALTQFNQPSCNKNGKYFIEKGGLPIVFGVFMQTNKKKKSNLVLKLSKEDFQEDERHVLHVLFGLLTMTEGLSHERVVFKFIENNFEKLQRLIELHLKLWNPLSEFDLDKFENAEEVGYLVEEFDLEILELVDVIIGYL